MKHKQKMSQLIKIQRDQDKLQLTKLDPEKFKGDHQQQKTNRMTSSSKHFPSISSFISHAANLEEMRFPEQQIAQYCKENEVTHQKITNMFQAYYQKFKWNYDNFNQIIILLSIAIKKIQFRSNKHQDTQESQIILRKAFQFLEDVITSKMVLVCLASKNQHKSISQHFIYAKGFLCLFILQVLNFELHSELIGMIENCNTSDKSINFIGLNFIVQLMVLSTTVDFLSEESEKKFKTTVMSIMGNKKKVIVDLLWNGQKMFDQRIEFREIAYPRRDVESYKVNYLEITNEGNIYVNERHTFQPEDWIMGAYNKAPNGSVWRGISLKTVVDIYQFLFKLQVFASSPLIEELDLLIPDSEEFIEVFSKFLMGENLVEVEGSSRDKQSASVIRSIFDIKKMLEGANKAEKNILKRQLSKICSDSGSEEDQENTITSELESYQ